MRLRAECRLFTYTFHLNPHCTSFLTSIYGQDIEAIKQEIETWVIKGEKIGEITKNSALPDLSDMQSRYSWWSKNKKAFRLEFINEQINSQRLMNLQRLRVLERLEQLEQNKTECLKLAFNDYSDYEYQQGDVVYCDIPYKGTDCRSYKGFNHDAFWNWAKTRPFDVYVSERTIPTNVHAEILFCKQVPNRANTKGIDGFKTEYLVRV